MPPDTVSAMSILTEPKIDCHNHILDPARFAYEPHTAYRPSGQEVTSYEHLITIMDTYGVTHALVVGPNSGYGPDNRCLLDALARGAGRLKGIAVVPLDIGTAELQRLKAAGVVGIAFNTTLLGTKHYLGTGPLLERLADLGLYVQLQVEHDQLVDLMPLLVASRVRILVDHCGRPNGARGVAQPGFQALLELGRGGRAAVKISGVQKFSAERFPFRDAWPYVEALAGAFTLERCMWGSDWPFLKATDRLDYGPMIRLAGLLFPDARERHKLFVETPTRLFGFTTA